MLWFIHTLASTKSNLLVIRYAFIPSKSIQGSLHAWIGFFVTLGVQVVAGPYFSSNLILAPCIIKYLIISPRPSSISVSSFILNVSNAIYSGHLCYFKHLHYRLDFYNMGFINYMHDLNCVFDEPFFWFTVAVFVMNRLKLLMNLPFYISNMALGFAPACSIFLAVSKSSLTKEKNNASLRDSIVTKNYTIFLNKKYKINKFLTILIQFLTISILY